jgi:hypothetical protein
METAAVNWDRPRLFRGGTGGPTGDTTGTDKLGEAEAGAILARLVLPEESVLVATKPRTEGH